MSSTPREAALRHDATLRGDLVGGVTTFFTMAYIVVVNPSILATEGTGLSFSGVLTATVLLAFACTLLMGLYAKLPFAVAPGMGINAFFTFTVILTQKVPWQTALGLVFWAGVLFLVISVTPVREIVARAIPFNLRVASAAGIGVFLAFIGLKGSGFIAADPVTFVKVGPLGLETLLCGIGVLIIGALLHKKSPFAFLLGIAAVTGLAYVSGHAHADITSPFALPDFTSVFLQLDVVGALDLAFLPAIIAILFTDLFDSISTFVGVSQATGLLDEKGEPKNLRKGLIVDAVATLGAGLVGTSSGTAYIESAAGIEMGGRTGRAAVVTAVCFLPCLFIAPLAGLVPAYATAPVLVVVGALMFRSVLGLRLERLEDALPTFLTIALIPLTFSITQGLLWGFVAHAALYTLVGRRREVSGPLWVIAAVSAGLLVLEAQR